MQSFEGREQSIEDQAAYWLIRLSASNCTPEDRYAFEAWKQEDPAHEQMYLRLQKGNAVVDRHMTDPRILAMLEEARVKPRAGPMAWISSIFTPGFTGRYVAIAATVVIAVLAGGTAFYHHVTSEFESQLVAATDVFEVFETSVGERSTITLADNSTVSINTNSRLKVRFSDHSRLIRLTHGQAFFEVQKDIDRPFIVEAGDQRVVALGTAFDVRFDKEHVIEVTLVEGRVKIDSIADSGEPEEAAGSIVPRPPIELIPGQRLVALENAAPEIVATDTIEETSWRNGQLIFRHRPLANAVEEYNRYSTQKIVLNDDPRVQDIEVDGVMNTGGPASSFVNALSTLYPLKAERTGENELTLVYRE